MFFHSIIAKGGERVQFFRMSFLFELPEVFKQNNSFASG